MQSSFSGANLGIPGPGGQDGAFLSILELFFPRKNKLLIDTYSVWGEQVLSYLDQAARTASEQTVAAGKLELSAVYSKFRTISHRVHELIDIIRQVKQERTSTGR